MRHIILFSVGPGLVVHNNALSRENMIIRVLYTNNTGADQRSLTNANEVFSPENRTIKLSLTKLSNIRAIFLVPALPCHKPEELVYHTSEKLVSWSVLAGP